jgi:glutamate-1-semialdehyde 2,1-aminomutase
VSTTFAAPTITDFAWSKQLRDRVHDLIPGGCHTYAKGDDQYPELAPAFIARGQGCHVWDVDGNQYIEYGMGCRAVTLGHAYPPVVKAAQEQMLRGANFTRPALVEFECAEKFLEMIDGAEMVKFAKDGSSATTAALKLARAHTGRDYVACCSDHPFFATHDWFIGTTPLDAGIPEAVKNLTLTFRYNDIQSVRELFERYPNKIAALILEPAKYEDPEDGYLHKVRDLCHANGAIFILDEMITGFRWHNGGAQKYYDITPDLSAFGKALGNGFSVSALAGKRELMELGGLFHDRERVFLLSTTHGAETHALAAAIAVMETYQNEPVIERLNEQGEKLRTGANQVIARHGLEEYVEVLGRPCNLVFATRDQQKQPSQTFRALFMQEIIKRGVLGPSFVISYSHADKDVERTVEAVDGAMYVYGRALENGVKDYLVGPPTNVVYRRYTWQ